MELALAVILPFLYFFLIGRPISGIIALALQLTVFGWIIAAIWAISAYRKNER